jgi:hypothetical protein
VPPVQEDLAMEAEAVSMIFQAACSRIAWPCGCGWWLQWESGRWVRKYWECNRHEVKNAARGTGG